MTDPTSLDGNAAAGPLRALFAVDLTTARSTCGSCGHARPLAEQPLYERAPAMVLRCRDCDEVLMRWADDGGQMRLDMTGTRLLVVPAHDPSA
jgi:hypothetical protein